MKFGEKVENFSEAIADAPARLSAEAFKYCDSLVPEAHAWAVTKSMLEERCVLANQVSLLIQCVIFT